MGLSSEAGGPDTRSPYATAVKPRAPKRVICGPWGFFGRTELFPVWAGGTREAGHADRRFQAPLRVSAQCRWP